MFHCYLSPYSHSLLTSELTLFLLPMWTKDQMLFRYTKGLQIISGLLRHPALGTEQLPRSRPFQGSPIIYLVGLFSLFSWDFCSGQLENPGWGSVSQSSQHILVTAGAFIESKTRENQLNQNSQGCNWSVSMSYNHSRGDGMAMVHYASSSALHVIVSRTETHHLTPTSCPPTLPVENG